MRTTAKLLTLMMVAPVVASAQVLTFEGVNTNYPSSGYATVGDFYNGGLSGDGNTGTNYGISFGSNALGICLNSIGAVCSNTSRGGLGDPASERTGLFFLEGDQTFMNVASGFSTGFSFYYSAIGQGGSVLVYDDLNGTGNLLATIALTVTPSDCPPGYSAGFCPFFAAGTTFVGLAKSVAWGGVADQIVFDDVTLGSSTPGNPSDVVPEPATMTLLATGLLGMAAARKKRRTA
jgi:hypothetical protein